MKRFIYLKKTLAVILATLVFLSGFSVITVSAANFLSQSTGHNAQIIDSGATVDEVSPLAASGETSYNVNGNSSWGMRWTKTLNYTNAVTGVKETLYANQKMNYHTINLKGSSKKTMVWCIQPYLCINNNGNYYKIDSGSSANKTYWNKFKDSSVKKAVAATIAFAKPKISGDGAYYQATGLLIWEYIMGQRNPTTYNLTSSGKSLISYVSCSTTDKKNNLKKAYDYILNQLKTIDDMPDGLYTSISKAKNGTRMKLRGKSSNYSSTKTISGLKNYDLSYSIVNQNGNAPSADKNFKVSVSGNKLTVSTTADLYNQEQKGNTYYVKVTKNFDCESSSSNLIYQNSSANSQTLANSVVYSKPNVVAYYGLYADPDPTPDGSLQIIKDITTTSEDLEYSGDYSGWYFLATNKTTYKSYVLSTNKNGETGTIDNITLGTKFDIEEMGRLLPANYDEDKYTDTFEYDGKKYGIPADFKNITGGTKTVTVSGNDLVQFTWKNQYNPRMRVKLTKTTDDNETVEGYYFLVYDIQGTGASAAIKTPTIIGPTDANGEIEFTLDNACRTTLGVIELGFLKEGCTYDKYVESILTDNYADNFEIPDRYNLKTGYYYITGIDNSVPFTIDNYDFKNNYAEFEFDNTTSGYISINKTESVSNKPLGGAVYGVYTPTQPLDDPDTNPGDNVYVEDNEDHSGSDDSGENNNDNENNGEDTEEESESNLVCTMTTDENGYAISESIPTGTYYVKEISAPDGYSVSDEIYEVEVTPGSNTVANPNIIDVKVTDKPTYININKIEASTLDTNGNPVVGAKMQILDSSNNIVYEYTTSDKTESIIGLLKAGETYTIHEVSAPDGYVIAKDQIFTVSMDGSIDEVTVEDKTTKVKLSKVDITNSEELEGAELQITDKGGNIIDSWTSTKEAHIIEGKLIAGETYTLTETKPANGYVTADSVEFTVLTDGSVQAVTMTDDITKVSIKKTDITGENEVEGAELQITDKDGNVIDSWTSTKEAHLIEGKLIAGETYTLTETKPANGYVTADNIEFTVEDTGKIQALSMKDDTTKVEFVKVDKTTNEALEDAKLELKDKDGNVVDSWTTTTEAYLIEGKLKAGAEYTLSEKSAPKGYIVADDIKFTVNTDGKMQTITMKDEKVKEKVDLPKTGGNTKNAFLISFGLTITMAGIFVFCKAKIDK